MSLFLTLACICGFQMGFGQSEVLRQAGLLYGDGEMTQSAVLYEQAYQYYLQRGYLDSAALAIADKGAPVAFSTNLKAGIELVDQGLRLYQSLDSPSYNIEINIYGEAIRLYSTMGNADTTSYFLDKTNRIIDQYADQINKKDVAIFYWNLSYTQYLKGDLNSAHDLALQAKKLFVEVFGDESGQHAAVLDWLGTLNRDLSRYDKAIDYAKQSIHLAEKENDPTFNLAISYNNLAGVYINIDDHKNALIYSDKALELGRNLVVKAQIDPSYLYTFHSTRAQIYRGLKKINEALLEFKKAESAIAGNDDVYATYLFSNIIQCYSDLDSLEMAHDYREKMWTYYNLKGAGNRDDYSHFLSVDGGLDYKFKNYDAALIKLNESIRIRDSIFLEPEYYITAVYESQGRTYCAMDSVEQALRSFQYAKEIGKSLFNLGHESLLSYALNRATCLYEHGRKAEAEQVLLNSINEIGIDTSRFVVSEWTQVTMQPSVRKLLSTFISYQIDKLKRNPDVALTAFLMSVVELYIEYIERYIAYYDSFSSHMNIEDEYFETLASVIVALYKDEMDALHQEFIFKCMQKSKTLISRLILNDVSMDHFGGVPDSIVAKELELRSQLNMTANQLMDKSYKLGETEDAFLSKEREYRKLQQHIQSNYPDYYNLKYDFSVPTMKNIRQSLSPRAIFLDYFISDSFALVAWVTAHKSGICKLPTTRADLNLKIEALNQLILDVGSQKWKGKAVALYRDLIAPLELDFKAFDRIFICPDGPMFELPMELCLVSDQLRPFPIVYLVSANDAIGRKAITQSDHTRVLGFAPSFTHLKKADVLPQPFSRALAQKIAMRFEADIYFDQDANETLFKAKAGNYPILHISTHGVLDENEPLSSYLLLYEDTMNDGRLTLYELYGMRLQSNLALLNACSTSKGKFRKGAGMASLASGFQFAGCSNLISSLWSVDEQANARIIEKLYGQLEQGVSPATALYEAKKSFITDAPAELKHPYYWAGITFIGVQDEVNATGFSYLYELILMGLGLIVLIIIVSWFTKRFKGS